MTTNVERSSSSSQRDDERTTAAPSMGISGAASFSASRAHDFALFARLDALEAHPLLRGPLDLIEAREDHARRLTALVDAVAAFLVSEY